MSDRERLYRAEPTRTGPVRNFSNLYRRPDPSGFGVRAEESDRTQGPGGGTVNSDPLSKGVALAYRVLEEYFDAGRRTAEQISRPGAQSSGSMAVDSLQELLERVLRFQSEILPLTVEILGGFLKSDAPRDSTSPPAATPHDGVSAPTIADVEVVSLRAARVSLELGHSPDFQRLTAQGLRALDHTKPPLTEVSFGSTNSNGRGSVSIRIPTDQPSGIYSGVVVDRETGELRGTLTVRIAE